MVVLPTSVTIREVGPREGFQILPRVVETSRKLELINALVAAGLREIEVASFVRPDKVPTMADAEGVVAGLPVSSQTRFSALYLNVRGFQRAESTGRLHNRGWLYTSPSASFLRANNGTTIEDDLAQVPEWSAEFRRVGKRVDAVMVSTAFGCAIEGAIKPSAVVRLVERYLSACGALNETVSEVCLADTVGLANPGSVAETVRLVKSLGVSVSLHVHDTWGLGLSNVYAGLCEGVTTFESSVGGLGGCPFTPGASGNVATEGVVYLCHALGIETSLNLDALCRAAEVAESIVGGTLSSGVYQAWKRSGRRLPFAVENRPPRD